MNKTIIIFLFISVLFSCVSIQDTPIAETKDQIIIVIDPGHGGKDNGAFVNYETDNGTITYIEKDLALTISKLLAAELKIKLPQSQVILTRTDDVYLSLEDRVIKANQLCSGTTKSIFVSIHVNYSQNTNASGFDVYYRMPVLLDPDAYISVQFLKSVMQNNAPLAQAISESVGGISDLQNLPRSVKTADYHVLRNNTAAAVLIECGFLSNKSEALLLNDVFYQKKIVEGIALGIESFLKRENV
jgi:N-acetylmuramoyl-L-alanine amidase